MYIYFTYRKVLTLYAALLLSLCRTIFQYNFAPLASVILIHIKCMFVEHQLHTRFRGTTHIHLTSRRPSHSIYSPCGLGLPTRNVMRFMGVCQCTLSGIYIYWYLIFLTGVLSSNTPSFFLYFLNANTIKIECRAKCARANSPKSQKCYAIGSEFVYIFLDDSQCVSCTYSA